MSFHDKLKAKRAGNRVGTGWKPKEGPNRVRILPPHSRFIGNWEALEDLSVNYNIHYFRIEGRPTEVSRCLEEFKQRCPACDMWRAHRKSEDAALKELARSLGPANQYLFNILDLNDLQAGIQRWAANYTCWDKILEIAANAVWGNIIDPTNGVDFTVTLTPGRQNRSGQNSYSVMPDPNRTNVQAVLDSIPNWQAVLDSLVEHITPPKTEAEIRALVDEMPFPKAGGATRVVPTAVQPVGVQPVAAAPGPVYTGPAVVIPGAQPASIAAPTPVSPAPVAAPQPVAAPVAISPATVAAPQPVQPVQAAPVAPAAAVNVHYDPGPAYEAKPLAPGLSKPGNAPRCYGDYNPEVHACGNCPVVAQCQMVMLGIATS